MKTKHTAWLTSFLLLLLLMGLALVLSGFGKRLMEWAWAGSRPAADPLALVRNLEGMWNHGNISGREFVVSTLQRESEDNADLFSRMLPTVQAAAIDVDLSVREMALGILAEHNHPSLVHLAQAQLTDTDPAVRELGWRFLNKSVGTNQVSLVPPLNPKESVSLPPRLPAGNFTLTNLEAKPVSLSDFKGKLVLLNFFDPEFTNSLRDLPVLVQLQRSAREKVEVLGIYIDVKLRKEARRCNCGNKEHHDHDHAQEAAALLDPVKTRARLQPFVQEQRLNFPVLLDPAGTVIGRYSGEVPSTTLLIDSDGNVRRRFTEPRSLECLQVMVKELESPR